MRKKPAYLQQGIARGVQTRSCAEGLRRMLPQGIRGEIWQILFWRPCCLSILSLTKRSLF